MISVSHKIQLLMMKLLCPICQDVLYETSSKRSYRIYPGRVGRIQQPKAMFSQYSFRNIGKPPLPPPVNPVVTSRCGHIFHKKCIMNYMRAYRAEFKESAVECPCCKCQVILAIQMPIDFGASEKCEHFEGREFNLIKALNTELKEQAMEQTHQLFRLEQKMKETLQKFHLEDYATQLRNEKMKAEEKTQRAQGKLKRAEEKVKKATAYLQIVRERSRRLESNWQLGELDEMESEEVSLNSEEMIDQNKLKLKPPLPPLTKLPKGSLCSKNMIFSSSHGRIQRRMS